MTGLISGAKPYIIKWTLEYGRKLTTRSRYDVQFQDPGKEYYFGIAIFDNAQTRHSYQAGVNRLIFASSPTAAQTKGAASGGQIITPEDYGNVITLKVNESFLLKLGEGYDWNVTVDDQTILSRVLNVIVVRGAQGIYKAHRPGNTTLTAYGDPICRKEQPPCAAPSREFRIYLVVTDGLSSGTQGFEGFLAILALIVTLHVMRRRQK